MPGIGFAYGKGHGKGKPNLPPKSNPPPTTPPPSPPPTTPPVIPPPIISPPPITSPPPNPFPSPTPVRRRNVVTFVTRGVQGIRYKRAEHGFHGYINKPTNFLVGESGKERVDISPLKKKKGKSYGDYDFLGSYNDVMRGFFK